MTARRSDTGRFVAVPNWALRRLGADPGAFTLYAALLAYADYGTGECWPSRQTLADDLGCSVDTVDRRLRTLVDAGVVDVVRRRTSSGSSTSNLFLVRRVDPEPGRADAAGGGPRNRGAGAADSPSEGAADPRPEQETIERDLLNETSRVAVPATRDRGGLSPETRATLDAVFGDGDPSRRRDHLWEALIVACGIDPDAIPTSARGAYNRAARDLRALDATPDDVVARAESYRRLWPSVSLTPTALVRRWAEVDPTRPGTAPEGHAAVESVRRAIRGGR